MVSINLEFIGKSSLILHPDGLSYFSMPRLIPEPPHSQELFMDLPKNGAEDPADDEDEEDDTLIGGPKESRDDVLRVPRPSPSSVPALATETTEPTEAEIEVQKQIDALNAKLDSLKRDRCSGTTSTPTERLGGGAENTPTSPASTSSSRAVEVRQRIAELKKAMELLATNKPVFNAKKLKSLL